MIEPKPCPFCGSENIWTYTGNSYDGGDLWMYNKYAQCNGCYTRTKQFLTEEEAIKQWNKRV